MGEPQVLQLSIIENDGAIKLNLNEDTDSNAAKHANPNGDADASSDQPNDAIIKSQKRHRRWLRVAMYVILLLLGQSTATLLGRQYYQKGGKSKWMGTLVQVVGFPILLPFYCIPASEHPTTATNSIHNHNHNHKQPSVIKLAFVYLSLGLLVALHCYLFSIGLSYLPVSTYSIICSLELAFTAIFSFFLNSQKFTPYIINSLVLLTISSILLVFEPGSSSSSESSTQVSKKKYVTGFICTVAASAGFALEFSLTQYVFRKVLRKESFRMILDMLVYQSLTATLATLVGLFGSGEFRSLKREMEEYYEMGKASYVLNLSFTAITWQIFTVGCLGLILEVSSVFCDAVSVVGFPIVPILAVVIFHDTMHGLKVISLLLALWGFCSYIYQQYLDEIESNTKPRSSGDSCSDSPSQEMDGCSHIARPG